MVVYRVEYEELAFASGVVEKDEEAYTVFKVPTRIEDVSIGHLVFWFRPLQNGAPVSKSQIRFSLIRSLQEFTDADVEHTVFKAGSIPLPFPEGVRFKRDNPKYFLVEISQLTHIVKPKLSIVYAENPHQVVESTRVNLFEMGI